MDKIKVGIIDTMFSRVNMGEIAIDEIKKDYQDAEIVRKTVPGIKDLPPECLNLLQKENCDICMALGMVGGAPVDLQCAHEASLGIMQAKLLTGKHIIEVFVHENEAWNEKEFYSICENRIRKHAHNAVLLVAKPDELIKNAGKGVRQGKEDEGAIEISKERPLTLGIAVAEFNKRFADEMLEFALDEAKKNDAEVHSILRVPGAFEIPLATKKLLWDKKIDAVVTLGYVKKGETKHDKIVAENSAREIMQLSLENRKPVTLGMITLADAAQAEERKEGYARRAVRAAVKMVNELRRW